MTEVTKPITHLKQQCVAALAAFDLSLDEQNDPPAREGGNLLVLKQDQESTVLQARCIEDGVSRLFIAKQRSGQNNLVAFALTARVEELLINAQDASSSRTTEEARSLFPKRRLTSKGKAYWLDKQVSEKGSSDSYCWSVSQYIAHAPAFDWLEEQPSWTPTHAGAAGELLAKLHCAGRAAKSNLSAEEQSQLASVLPSLPQSLRSAMQSGLPSVGEQQLLAIGSALDLAVTALNSGDDSAAPADDQLIVHGDFHPGNILFNETSATTVVDLDYAHLEHPLYDLAYALLMFAPTEATAPCAVSFVDRYQHYFNQAGQPLPTFLPDRATLETTFSGTGQPSARSEDAHSPFYNYLVVAASLILLWTLGPVGKQHPRVDTVTARMIRRISAV